MKSTLPAFLMAVFFATVAHAQQNINLRGSVMAFDGKIITVKTRDGGDVKIDLPDTVNVNATKTFSMAEVKPGMVLGVTTVKRADGATVAIDVRPIPATAPQGLSPFDLQPGSTMTNASVEVAVEAVGGQELVLNYKTGSVKVLVPPGTPMSQATPGNRSDIKPGETIFVSARPGEGGTFTAVRVQVSKDGVKPTQ